MTDKMSKKDRSLLMSKIKSNNTKLEIEFKRHLDRLDLMYEINNKEIRGKPDFVLKNKRIAIFLDSCFWHGCRKHCRMPKSNLTYWRKKIKGNMKRDRTIAKYLRNSGWIVIRIWEHDRREGFNKRIQKLKELL